MKKGIITKKPQWWKHLREWKKIFWKKHRSAERRKIKKETL